VQAMCCQQGGDVIQVSDGGEAEHENHGGERERSDVLRRRFPQMPQERDEHDERHDDDDLALIGQGKEQDACRNAEGQESPPGADMVEASHGQIDRIGHREGKEKKREQKAPGQDGCDAEKGCCGDARCSRSKEDAEDLHRTAHAGGREASDDENAMHRHSL
jgi:hypothetical protein